jgi:hypothetical protein
MAYFSIQMEKLPSKQEQIQSVAIASFSNSHKKPVAAVIFPNSSIDPPQVDINGNISVPDQSSASSLLQLFYRQVS